MKSEIVKAFFRIGVEELNNFQKKLNRVYISTNKSVIIQAKNGHGKTLGCLYSILTNFDLSSDGTLSLLTQDIALLILPTRELAYQVFNQIGSINCYLRTAFFRVKLCIGGLSLKEDQQSILSLNPNIIVGSLIFLKGEKSCVVFSIKKRAFANQKGRSGECGASCAKAPYRAPRCTL